MTPQTLTSPVLEDAALLLVQNKLDAGLSWLTTAYGRAQKMIRKSGDGRDVYFPGVHAVSPDGKDYIPLFPDEGLGNFSFFDLNDDQEVSNYVEKQPLKNIHKFGANLIVWFDFQTVYPSPADWRAYSTANVMQQVMDVLQTATLPSAHLIIGRRYQNTENVYRGYDYKEIASQFNMRPYGCLKIEMEITYKRIC